MLRLHMTVVSSTARIFKGEAMHMAQAEREISASAGSVVGTVLLIVCLLASVACTGSPPTGPAQGHALPTLLTQTEKPPKGSLPYLDTGMHTALISRISVDAANR